MAGSSRALPRGKGRPFGVLEFNNSRPSRILKFNRHSPIDVLKLNRPGEPRHSDRHHLVGRRLPVEHAHDGLSRRMVVLKP